MNIAYLLETTEVAGGVRVAAAHADALLDRGHQVTILTSGPPLTWRASRARWQFLRPDEPLDVERFDFVVATFWTTVARAFAAAGDRAIHFCQGYEGSFTAYRPLKPLIDAAYRTPVPKITVSPHLVEICRRFYPDATCVGQIVDSDFFQPHVSRIAGRPRVLLAGPAQSDFKGIDLGYAAVRRARARGAQFDLVRVSQWSAAADEPVELATEFHTNLDTRAMADLFASCDIFLGPSREEEGFGLPAAEAMASGVPAVLSAISSFSAWDVVRDYALFAPAGDAEKMGDALAGLIGDPSLRERLAARGREVVEQFRAEKTGARLEQYFAGRLQRR